MTEGVPKGREAPRTEGGDVRAQVKEGRGENYSEGRKRGKYC